MCTVALLNGQSISVCCNSQLECRHLFVDIDALRADMLILKGQIGFCPLTRALAVWLRQVLEAHDDKKLKFRTRNEVHDGYFQQT